jgi:hypothetical protein
MRALAVTFGFLVLVTFGTGCARREKTTHTTSAAVSGLAEKKAFLERFVTFRRHYEALDYKIDFDDETTLAPGPSTTACDVRIYAKIPSEEAFQWIDGLEADPAAPTAERLAWTKDVPSAPASTEGYAWYRDKPGPSKGEEGKMVGLSKDRSEVLYRLVCTRN